ncbi:MAG: HEAT repeat domain-containing protein [Kiritimatiellia bacterium]
MVTKSGPRIIQNQLKEKAPLPWHTASHIAKNPPADLQAELESLLDSPELDKKLIGAAGLVRLGDPAGVPLLEKALQTMPDLAKILAAETLAGAGNEEGLDTLLQIIAGKDWGLRLSALEALGEFSQNSEALSTLRQHLQDQDLWTRVAAAAGLARMGDEQGISLLHTYLDSPDPAISIFAAERLAAQGDPSPAGLFEKELQSQDPFEQVHGAAGLMMLGDDRGYDILMSALAQEHEPLGLYAAQLSLRLSSLASDQK